MGLQQSVLKRDPRANIRTSGQADTCSAVLLCLMLCRIAEKVATFKLPVIDGARKSHGVAHSSPCGRQKSTTWVGWYDVDCHCGGLPLQGVATHAHDAVVVVQGVGKGAALRPWKGLGDQPHGACAGTAGISTSASSGMHGLSEVPDMHGQGVPHHLYTSRIVCCSPLNMDASPCLERNEHLQYLLHGPYLQARRQSKVSRGRCICNTNASGGLLAGWQQLVPPGAHLWRRM